MSGGELLSLLINIAVGIYLAWYFPASLRGKLDRMPRLFTVLNRLLPPLGYLLIIASLVFAALRLSGQV